MAQPRARLETMPKDTSPSVIMPAYPGNSFPGPPPQAELARVTLPPKPGNAFAQQKEAKRLRDQATRQVIALRAAQDPESSPTPATFVSPAIRHTEVEVPPTIQEEPIPTAATTWSAVCAPDTTQEERRNAEARKQLENLQADARARLFQDAPANVEEAAGAASSLFSRLRNRLNSKGTKKPLPELHDTSADVYAKSPSHFIIPSPTPALTVAPSRRPNATVSTGFRTPLTTRQTSGATVSTIYTDTIPSFRRGNSAMITAQPLHNQFTTPTRFGTYASNGRGQLAVAPSFNSMVGSVSVAELAERSVVDTTQGGEEEEEEESGEQGMMQSVIDVEKGDEEEEGLAGLKERMARIERKLDRILAVLGE